MDVEEQEWIERILMNYERNRCISKFCSVEGEDAIPKGNNYNSDIMRKKTKVVLNSGDIEERSVIFKMLPKTEHRRKTQKYSGTTVTEARMFTEVLPKVEKYQLLKDKHAERLTPICYGIRNGNEDFLLEDLNVKGFRLPDRFRGLDYHHMVLATDTLAKYHAICAVLIEKGEITSRDYDNNYLINQEEAMGAMFRSSYEELAREIESSWGPEWQPYVEKIRTFSKTLMKVILESLKKDATNFKTLNHGDYWLANMMFRHDTDGTPNAIRMIDFQLCTHITPVMDMQYFLNTSPAEDALAKKREIFHFYCHRLLHYLEMYEYRGRIPTREELEEAYEVTKPYGLTVALIFRPFMMAREDQVVDMEQLTKQFEENMSTKLCNYKNIGETSRRIIKINLKEGHEFGVL